MTDMPLVERIAEAMIRATTAPAEAGDDAVKNAREEDGTLWHFARVQAQAAIDEAEKFSRERDMRGENPSHLWIAAGASIYK